MKARTSPIPQRLPVIVLASLGVIFASATSASAAADDPEVSYERYQLENGIEVILHRDNSVPLVAVDLWYHVGARNEEPGHSGFAHLFEHMLFQGAVHIGEDAHFEVLRKIGASAINGSTNFDRTNYFEVVPSHQLETALWLESDRMGYFLPMLTEKSFRNQVDVVRNERRQRYDNVPYRGALFPLFEALYPEGHPHRHLVIGKHDHLEAATLEEVRNFYRTWYVPANATLTIAGDFETAAVKQLVEKWFGSFPASEKPPSPEVPAATVEKTTRLTYKDPFAKLRQLQYVWHAPPYFTEGDAELDVAADALAAPGTGRLYKRLVVQEQLAHEVSAAVWSLQSSSLFFLTVTLKTDADQAAVERIVQEELDRITREPIHDDEFNRAVIKTEANFIWGLESLLSRAETLQRYNHYVGTADYITEDLDRYRKSSPQDVLRMTKKYLLAPRVEVVIVPIEARKGKAADEKAINPAITR